MMPFHEPAPDLGTEVRDAVAVEFVGPEQRDHRDCVPLGDSVEVRGEVPVVGAGQAERDALIAQLLGRVDALTRQVEDLTARMPYDRIEIPEIKPDVTQVRLQRGDLPVLRQAVHGRRAGRA